MDRDKKQIIPTDDSGLLNRRVIEKSDTTYRVVSKNVSEYHFIVPFDLSGEDLVEVGQIFSIKDRGLTYLARVLNIEHSSNYDGHWDTTIKGTDFFDTDQIFDRVIAEPLGCVNRDGKFKKARTLPTKFSPVARAERQQFNFLIQVMGDIEVGYLRNGSRLVENIPVALHSEAMDHHMGVFATTGMGKSNFMKVFAASCMRLYVRSESKFGLLIVDPHGEYLKGKGQIKGLSHLRRYRDGLACYSTDRQNASDPGVEELAIGIKDIEPSDVELYFDWTAAQKDALEAIPRIFSRDWLSEIQAPEAMAKLLSENVFESTAGKISQRIKNLLAKNKYINNIRSSIPNILSNLQEGKVVLIDIPRMNDRSELFLLSVLSRCILDAYTRGFLAQAATLLALRASPERVASSEWGYAPSPSSPSSSTSSFYPSSTPLLSWAWETETTADSWRSRQSRTSPPWTLRSRPWSRARLWSPPWTFLSPSPPGSTATRNTSAVSMRKSRKIRCPERAASSPSWIDATNGKMT